MNDAEVKINESSTSLPLPARVPSRQLEGEERPARQRVDIPPFYQNTRNGAGVAEYVFTNLLENRAARRVGFTIWTMESGTRAVETVVLR